MNIFNPIQKENEVIYEMDEMDAIDISNIFLCEICYEYGDDSKKIKCNNDKCNKYMCENCFENCFPPRMLQHMRLYTQLF